MEGAYFAEEEKELTAFEVRDFDWVYGRKSGFIHVLRFPQHPQTCASPGVSGLQRLHPPGP